MHWRQKILESFLEEDYTKKMRNLSIWKRVLFTSIEMRAKDMLEKKNILDMNRKEYCSYVQLQYKNDPQWVRTRLISKWDQEFAKRNKSGESAGE